MIFLSEAALVEMLGVHALRLFPATDRIESEVPSCLGIADLVVARTDQARLRERAASGLTPITLPGAAQLLAAARDEPCPEEALFEAAGLKRPYGRRLVRDLAGSGHLRAQAGGWVRAAALGDPYELIIAIEAKLDSWSRALAQAVQYALYADLTYIAVPDRTAARVDLAAVAACGIGVIAVGSGVEVVLDAAMSSSVELWRRLYVSELLTARALDRRTPRATPDKTGSRFPRTASRASLRAVHAS